MPRPASSHRGYRRRDRRPEEPLLPMRGPRGISRAGKCQGGGAWGRPRGCALAGKLRWRRRAASAAPPGPLGAVLAAFLLGQKHLDGDRDVPHRFLGSPAPTTTRPLLKEGKHRCIRSIPLRFRRPSRGPRTKRTELEHRTGLGWDSRDCGSPGGDTRRKPEPSSRREAGRPRDPRRPASREQGGAAAGAGGDALTWKELV